MTAPRPAFSRHASGLLVPDAVARERQVWTTQERKLIDRVAKLLQARGVAMQMGCRQCHQPLEHVRTAAGFVMRCPHMDRVFTKGV